MAKKGRPAKYITVRRLNKNGKITQIKTERKVGIEQNKIYRQKAKTKKYTYGATQAELEYQKEVEEYLKQKIEKEKNKEFDDFIEEAEDLADKLLTLKVLKSPIKSALNSAKKSLNSKMKEAKNQKNLHEYKKSAGILFGINEAEQISSSVLSAGDFALSRTMSLQENYMGQQFVSNVEKTINIARQGISNIASGAVAGSALGPVGAVAGMAIGTVAFGVETYINYQQRMSGYYQQLNSTNFQTNFDQIKLGLINNSKGTEN